MYLLASLKDSSGLSETHETNRSGEEENPVHGRNTTVNVDKIRGFRLPYVWMKTLVFFLTLDRARTDRCFLYAYYGNPSKGSGGDCLHNGHNMQLNSYDITTEADTGSICGSSVCTINSRSIPVVCLISSRVRQK